MVPPVNRWPTTTDVPVLWALLAGFATCRWLTVKKQPLTEVSCYIRSLVDKTGHTNIHVNHRGKCFSLFLHLSMQQVDDVLLN